MTHTKGSWEISIIRDDEGIPDDVEIFPVGGEYPVAGINNTDEVLDWQANAQLISAAPDLLEACQKAVEMANTRNDYINNDNLLDILTHDLENAISKAKGK